METRKQIDNKLLYDKLKMKKSQGITTAIRNAGFGAKLKVNEY